MISKSFLSSNGFTVMSHSQTLLFISIKDKNIKLCCPSPGGGRSFSPTMMIEQVRIILAPPKYFPIRRTVSPVECTKNLGDNSSL